MPADCILWAGRIDSDGYGRMTGGYPAHRDAYEKHVGPIPAGLEIDHLCRVRACVNPAHMEPVTHAENIRRSVEHWPSTRAETCKNGHPFTPENTYIRPASQHGGRRQCRTCNREAVARYKERKQAS